MSESLKRIADLADLTMESAEMALEALVRESDEIVGTLAGTRPESVDIVDLRNIWQGIDSIRSVMAALTPVLAAIKGKPPIL